MLPKAKPTLLSSRKCFLLTWIFFKIFSIFSMEVSANPQFDPQIQQCLIANQTLSDSLTELNRKLEETQMTLVQQQREHNQKIQILQEQQVKLEQRQRQDNQKILQELQKLQELQVHINRKEIVILRRIDGSVDFYRTWDEFKQGFGNSSGEFFIGLDRLHQLTNSGPCELLIVLEDWQNERRYAKYDRFVVGSEREQYIIHSLGGYTGTAGDDFTYNLGQKFTTKDRDNDAHGSVNCAVLYRGAWWHRACYLCNLNGPYKKGRVDDSELGQIVQWHSFRGNVTSLKFAEMTIRLT